MLARLVIFALLPTAAVVAFLVAFFVFYRGGYDAPPSPDLAFEQITTSSAPSRITQELPPGPARSGLLVVDAQHSNAFTENELVSFTSQVSDRGFEVEFVGGLHAGAGSLAVAAPLQPTGRQTEAGRQFCGHTAASSIFTGRGSPGRRLRAEGGASCSWFPTPAVLRPSTGWPSGSVWTSRPIISTTPPTTTPTSSAS